MSNQDINNLDDLLESFLENSSKMIKYNGFTSPHIEDYSITKRNKKLIELANNKSFLLDESIFFRRRVNSLLGEMKKCNSIVYASNVNDTINTYVKASIKTNGALLSFLDTTLCQSAIDYFYANFSNARLLKKEFEEFPFDLLPLDDYCCVTGNETKAWLHILDEYPADLLLVTDYDIYYIPKECFSVLKNSYGKMQIEPAKRVVNVDNDYCFVVNRNASIFQKKFEIINFDDLLSYGSEGYIYTSGNDYAIKVFKNECSESKIEKLAFLMDFDHKNSNFAWPLAFTYTNKRKAYKPSGYVMEYYNKNDFSPLNTIFLKDISQRARWEVAFRLVCNVLFLYIFGMLKGDYNPNNFLVDDKLENVVFIDVDSLVYRNYPFEKKSPNPIYQKYDYSKYADVIKSEYVYLVAMTYFILSDGIWPFYYNEDIGSVVCPLITSKYQNTEEKTFISSLPNELKGFFVKAFAGNDIINPFDLCSLLIDYEKYLK